MNIDTERPEYEQHAEFNSRITYLSFKDKKGDSSLFNERMINEYEHRSVYNDEYVTFLIAGCALETELEFVAHNEATVARLTSSKTKAQDQPLFKLLKTKNYHNFRDTQEQIIANVEQEKKHFEYDDIRANPSTNEVFNVLNLANKVVSFTITMSIKNWHKTLIGRLSHQGVESDMLEIVEEIAKQLKAHYPVFFKTVSYTHLTLPTKRIV